MAGTDYKFLETLFGSEAKALIDSGKKDPEVNELVDDFAIAKIWKRKGLALRDRSLVTISSQIAAGKWDQVERHMMSFIHLGGTVEELREVCIHLSVYCGFPTMLTANAILKKVAASSRLGSSDSTSSATTL